MAADVQVANGTDISGVTSPALTTSWSLGTGSQVLQTSFVAPPSGMVRLVHTADFTGHSDTTGYILDIAPEVRLTNSSGAIKLNPADDVTCKLKAQGFGDRFICSASNLVTGLTSGATYWVGMKHKVNSTASTAAIIRYRRLLVEYRPENVPTNIRVNYNGADTAPNWTTSTLETAPASVTFTAPSSGRVLITLSASMESGASGNYVELSYRITDNRNGAVVVSPNPSNNGLICQGTDAQMAAEVVTLHQLTAGVSYTVKTYSRTSNTVAADPNLDPNIWWRMLMVEDRP